MNSIEQALKSATAFVTSMLPTTRGALQRAKEDTANEIFAHGSYGPYIDEEGNRCILFIMPITVKPEQQDHIEELIEKLECHSEKCREMLA